AGNRSHEEANGRRSGAIPPTWRPDEAFVLADVARRWSMHLLLVRDVSIRTSAAPPVPVGRALLPPRHPPQGRHPPARAPLPSRRGFRSGGGGPKLVVAPIPGP